MAKLKDLKVTIGLSKKGLSKLNADLRRTKGNFKRNFGEIASMAKNAAAAIGVTLVAGVAALIKKGAEMETLRTGFISIAGGANKAAAIVKELNEFTAKTPFQLQEVSSAARQLLAVGTERSELQKELKMLGDVAASSGNRINEISAIFAKVQAKGKVDLENLNQLAERNIPIFSELKKVTGDANMEFGAGAVSVEQFNTALANMTAEGGLAAGAMENLSETVEGRMTTLMDNLGQEMSKAAEKSGLMAGFGGLLKEATEGLQGVSGAAGSDVMAALGLAEEAMDGFGSVTTDNVDQVEQKMADAQAAIKGLVSEIKGSASKTTGMAFLFGGKAGAMESAKQQAEMLRPLMEMMEQLGAASVNLNEAVMGGGVSAPGNSGDDDDGLTKEEFAKQFKAASALITAREQLAAATGAVTFSEDEYAEALQDVRAAMGDVTDGHMEMVAMEQESPVFEEATESLVEYGLQLQKYRDTALQVATETQSAIEGMMQSVAASIGEGLGQALAGTQGALKNMGNTILMTLADLVVHVGKMAIGVGIAVEGIKTALKSLNPIVAVAAGVALIALGTMARTGLQNSINENVPQMADGGMFTGASLAMVGEGPGTSAINPEVVAPLDKLRNMMGGSNVTVTGRLDGRDILISNERANFDRNRVRGF